MDTKLTNDGFEVLEISGKFYAVLFDEHGHRISTDGPYADRYHAMSMSRIKELEQPYGKMISSPN